MNILVLLFMLLMPSMAHATVILNQDYEVANWNAVKTYPIGAGVTVETNWDPKYNTEITSDIVVAPTYPSATESTRGGTKALRMIYDCSTVLGALDGGPNHNGTGPGLWDNNNPGPATTSLRPRSSMHATTC